MRRYRTVNGIKRSVAVALRAGGRGARYTALHDFGVSGSSHARPRTTARGLINSGDKEQDDAQDGAVRGEQTIVFAGLAPRQCGDGRGQRQRLKRKRVGGRTTRALSSIGCDEGQHAVAGVRIFLEVPQFINMTDGALIGRGWLSRTS